MKIWFDILTPKQLLFFEPMIKKLKKEHKIICTSRRFREVVELAKIRKLKLHYIGHYGGKEKENKLKASVARQFNLGRYIIKQKPDICISGCSPDAVRVSYGLGIKTIGFGDSPHAEATNKLTICLLDFLLTPYVIPKREYTKFGIHENKILKYRAIDAMVMVNSNHKFNALKDFQTSTIVIRPPETQASYFQADDERFKCMVKTIAECFPKYQIKIPIRYEEQIKSYDGLGKNVILLKKVQEGRKILAECDYFVGSGGTMTAEAALSGIPTISYNSIPNYIEKFLTKIGLIKRGRSPSETISILKSYIESPVKRKNLQKKAHYWMTSMEHPYNILKKVIEDKT